GPWAGKRGPAGETRLDRLTLAVEHDRDPEDLVDARAIGGKGDDAGLDRAVLGVAGPQRRPVPPGRPAELGDKAEPLARLRVLGQLRVSLVEPGAGHLAPERAHHFGAAQSI